MHAARSILKILENSTAELKQEWLLPTAILYMVYFY